MSRVAIQRCYWKRKIKFSITSSEIVQQTINGKIKQRCFASQRPNYWVPGCGSNTSSIRKLAVPQLLQREITKQWARYPVGFWSPQNLLAGGESCSFSKSSSLTVKCSRNSRFFMYEEHQHEKLRDGTGPTREFQRTPSQLADLLTNSDNNGDDDNNKAQQEYYYWTSPIANVAPDLLKLVQGYETLHDDQCSLDPRGPSLWMGSSGSGTQAHYDVADNVLVQLFGTKRVRCYHPHAAQALHVFPDAHPRARKSQVNFDKPDHDRFPHFASLGSPVLDVVLQPGDALRIPAFWFHHVENGTIPGIGKGCSGAEETIPQDAPSVSLNIFALSPAMEAAREIFRSASCPFGVLPAAAAAAPTLESHHFQFSVAALRVLGWELLKGLGMDQTSIDAFIRTSLLDTRYTPLFGVRDKSKRDKKKAFTRMLTESEQEDAAACIARVLPQFHSLSFDEQEINGVSTLIVCHLLELWAVELVGANAVADAWEAALHIND